MVRGDDNGFNNMSSRTFTQPLYVKCSLLSQHQKRSIELSLWHLSHATSHVTETKSLRKSHQYSAWRSFVALKELFTVEDLYALRSLSLPFTEPSEISPQQKSLTCFRSSLLHLLTGGYQCR